MPLCVFSLSPSLPLPLSRIILITFRLNISNNLRSMFAKNAKVSWNAFLYCSCHCSFSSHFYYVFFVSPHHTFFAFVSFQWYCSFRNLFRKMSCILSMFVFIFHRIIIFVVVISIVVCFRLANKVFRSKAPMCPIEIIITWRTRWMPKPRNAMKRKDVEVVYVCMSLYLIQMYRCVSVFVYSVHRPRLCSSNKEQNKDKDKIHSGLL